MQATHTTSDAASVLEVDFNNSVTEDYSSEYHDRISFIQFLVDTAHNEYR